MSNCGLCKKIRRIFVRKAPSAMVVLSSIGLYTASMVPAMAATVNMSVVARLIRTVNVTVGNTMNFGTMALVNKEAGKVTLDPAASSLTVSGGSGLMPVGGTPQAGTLRVRGFDKPVELSVTNSIVKLTNGTDTVSVTDINFLTANGGAKITLQPQGADFSAVIPVGGSLNTKPQQLVGEYVGSLKISFNYQ